MPNLLRVRLSLKGRPLRTYTFEQKDVSIGRDPTCDICLDNTGISRQHARIQRTPGGYVVEDLGSANGTFLNEQPVKRDFIGHDDVVQIGKFAMWIGIDADRRERSDSGGAPAPAMYEGTVVLDPEALLDMQRKARDTPVNTSLSQPAPPRNEPESPAAGGTSRATLIAAVAAAFALGVAVGAAALHIAGS
jgi:predicted component of type VI protein secretion system